MLLYDTTAVLIIVARNNLFLAVRGLREVVNQLLKHCRRESHDVVRILNRLGEGSRRACRFVQYGSCIV